MNSRLPRKRGKEAAREKLAHAGLKPLALAIDEAAALCGLSATQFQKEVAAGNLPPPIRGLLSKHKRWSVAALEHAISGNIEMPADADDFLMREIKARARRVA